MNPERAALQRTIGRDVALAYAIECSCGGKVGYQITRATVDGDVAVVGMRTYHTSRDGTTEDSTAVSITGVIAGIERQGRARLAAFARTYHAEDERRAAKAEKARDARASRAADRRTRTAEKLTAQAGLDQPVETGSAVDQSCDCGGRKGYDFDVTGQDYLFWHTTTAGRRRTTQGTLVRLRETAITPDAALTAFVTTVHRLDLNEAAAPRGGPLPIVSPSARARAIGARAQDSADATDLERAVAIVRDNNRRGIIAARGFPIGVGMYVPGFATDARACACGGGVFWGKEIGRWCFRHVAPTDFFYENVAPDVVDEEDMLAAFTDKAHEEQERQGAAARYDALTRGAQEDGIDAGDAVALTAASGLAREDGRVIAAGSGLLFRSDRPITGDRERDPVVPPQEGDTMPRRGPSRIRDAEFVITGTLDRWSRSEAGVEIRRRGGMLADRVTWNTSALVVAKKPGKVKIAEARDCDVPTLSEEAFLALVAREDALVSNERATRGQDLRYVGVATTGARVYSGPAEQTLPMTPRPVARPAPAPVPVDPAVAQAQKLADLTAQARHARKRREL
jgi:hypothetical protein